MKLLQPIENKIFSKETLKTQLEKWREQNKKIVFTNGVFDILHIGHLTLLSKTAELADILIIAVNSDASVKRLKGPERPVNDQDSRSYMLASLSVTDAVIVFEEDTPLNLINFIRPAILVKGGDYNNNTIVGANEVINSGGKVVVIDLEEGYSTTNIISKIKNTERGNA